MKTAKITPIKDIITKPEQPNNDIIAKYEPPIKDIIIKSERPIMVFDVEHTGCMEQFVLQLSWGLYHRDGTLN